MIKVIVRAESPEMPPVAESVQHDAIEERFMKLFNGEHPAGCESVDCHDHLFCIALRWNV